MSINIIVVDGIFSLKKSKSSLFSKTGSWSHLSLVHFLSLSTGILSFFAVQAGAKKVYAIEASSMASHAEVCTVSGYQTCCCYKFICLHSGSPIDCLLAFCYTKEYLVC